MKSLGRIATALVALVVACSTYGEEDVIGTPDAGAVSFALVAECLVQQLSRTSTLVGKEQR